MRRTSGFTLVELLITLAIVTILLTQAVPAFRSVITNNKLVTKTNQLVTVLYLARSEAVKRGSRVTFCKSADGVQCANVGGYEQGWLVFTDPNNDGDFGAGERLIRSTNASANAGVTISGNAPVAQYVSYMPGGWVRQTNGALQMGTLTVCVGNQARKVIINRVGRIRTEKAVCE